MIQEPFADGNSVLHRIDPRLRLAAAVAFSTIVALSYRQATLICGLAGAFLMILASCLNFFQVIKRLSVLLGFLLLIWIVLPVIYDCVVAIARLIDNENLKDRDALFKSQKGGGPLTVQTIHKLVKGWCRAINLKGSYGSHTLRKTFGYHRRVTFSRGGLPELTDLYGHNSQRITLEYLCIQPEEIR